MRFEHFHKSVSVFPRRRSQGLTSDASHLSGGPSNIGVSATDDTTPLSPQTRVSGAVGETSTLRHKLCQRAFLHTLRIACSAALRGQTEGQPSRRWHSHRDVSVRSSCQDRVCQKAWPYFKRANRPRQKIAHRSGREGARSEEWGSTQGRTERARLFEEDAG